MLDDLLEKGIIQPLEPKKKQKKKKKLEGHSTHYTTGIIGWLVTLL